MSEDSEMVTQQIQQNFQDHNIISIRLDTEKELRKIEKNLRGGYKINIEDQETGEITTRFIEDGVRKVNDAGIQDIMNRLSTEVNPQTVQGNFRQNGKVDEFTEYMYHFRREVSEFLMNNLNTYEIDENDYPPIKQMICDFVELFLRRCIKNLERESYNQSLKSTESNIVSNRGKGLFNRG